MIVWMDPADCDPPHGLDLTTARDANKVNELAEAFLRSGFDESRPAVIGYPLNGRVQLLSGTHRHEAAVRTRTKLPVLLWLRSSIEESWGELDDWLNVMKDIPVAELRTWTREDVERAGRAARAKVTR